MKRASLIVMASLPGIAHAGPASVQLFVIDFEGLPELTPITDQYIGIGAFFSTPDAPELAPIIAVEGSPTIGFTGSGSDAPASSGSGSLTDPLIDGDFTTPNDIAIAFDPPVTSVSLYIIDVDGSDVFTLRAFDGEAEVDAQTISAGDPGTGNGASTLFSVAAPNITSILIDDENPTAQVGYAIDFVTFTRPCDGAACGPRVQVAQESAPGAGDFDDNILGEVLPFPFAGAPAEFYAYNVPQGDSWNGAALDPVPQRSHIILSSAFGAGTSIALVHDRYDDGSGGDAETLIEISGDPDGAHISVYDDPSVGAVDEYTGEPGDSTFSADHAWQACCTDGYMISGLGCTWTAYVQFTDVNDNPNDATINNIDEWVAYSATGDQITLALEEDRRVRLVQLPSDCTGDLDFDLFVSSTDLNLVLAQFGCTDDCCADVDGDGDVDSLDLNLILGGFGQSCQ